MFPQLSGREKCLSITSFIGFILIIVTLVLALYGFPRIIETVLEENIAIKRGTDAWDRFEELPIPLNFKITMFNITNKDEMLNKEKPIMTEIGPFVFKETRLRHNITVNGEFVSYYQRSSYEFDRTATPAHLSMNMKIMTSNAVILGMYQILEKADVAMPFDIDEVLPQVIPIPDLVYEEDFNKLMFGGVEVCNRSGLQLNGKIVCLIVTLLNLKMIDIKEDLSMSYSFFSFKSKDDGPYVMNTGTKDISKVGSIIKWNNGNYMDKWKGEKSECNKVQGHDQTVFPPYVQEGSTIKIFTADVCRTVDLEYHSIGKYRDIDTYTFRMGRGLLYPKDGETADESCYCAHETKGIDGEPYCFLDGLLDIQSCMGIPAVLSLPHFLDAENYTDAVGGLNASFEKHGSEMEIQPLTGIPVSGYMKFQINLVLRKSYINGKLMELTKNVYETMMPIAWVEQGVDLEGDFYDIITNAVFVIYLVQIMQWVLVGIAVAMFILPGVVFAFGRTGRNKFELK